MAKRSALTFGPIDLPPGALIDFCQRWQIVELALFGSVLRDDFRPESDVDCLVTFAPGADWGLLDLVGMEFDLEELLGRRADLVERVVVERSPNRLRREEILGAARVVYSGTIGRRCSTSRSRRARFGS